MSLTLIQILHIYEKKNKKKIMKQKNFIIKTVILTNLTILDIKKLGKKNKIK